MLDERPQYEISSGKYVRFYRYCQYCPKIGNSIFIPVSGSLPSKLYATICGEVQRERAKQGDIIAQARLDRQRVNRATERGKLEAEATTGDPIAQAIIDQRRA
jgi:hypothetical protein